MTGRRRHLIELLRAHEASTAAERQFQAQMLTLCEATSDPFARDHWDPGHFTASAFVLSPNSRSVLLIFHGKLHRWLQPGGHVDPDDLDILGAARREVLEETGLADLELVGDGLFDVDVHLIPARKSEPAHRHFDARILLRARTLEFAAGSDALDARWVPLDEVSVAESDDSVMRAIGKIRVRHG